MPFVLPTFNLTCDIYTWLDYGVNPPRLADVPCQLRASSGTSRIVLTGLQSFGQGMLLLLPAGTDIRDHESTPINSTDVVEVPSGSGRAYLVCSVDDIGKGFANEHRFAIIMKQTFLPWPTPAP